MLSRLLHSHFQSIPTKSIRPPAYIIYIEIYTPTFCSQLAFACLDGDEDGTAEDEHEEEEAEEEGHEDDEEKSEELLDAEEYDSI